MNNDYPKKFLRCTKINYTAQNNPDPTPNIKYVSAPYIRGASERMGSLLKAYNVRLSNKSSNTLKKHLCKLKDQRPIID